MKEDDFIKELEEMRFDTGLIIPAYYGIDEKGNVQLDEESIRDECESKIKEIQEILK